MHACLRPLPLVAALTACFANGAWAANFNITGNSSTAQTLGASQTGTVTSGASLTVSGTGVAVTVTGNNASLTNLGTISQTGTGRVVRDNTGVTGLVITNGSATNNTALMQAADADVVQMNKAIGGVTLNNYGQMLSFNASAGGAQVVDFNAVTSSPNTVNNYAGALMRASEADAVRPGVNGVVNNWGTFQALSNTGSSSDGIDFQTNSGGQVNNYATGQVLGARHGITGGALDATVTFTALVNNDAGGLIQGNNGSGLNFDGFNNKQLVTVVNAGRIIGNGVTGDGDGIDVDGLVKITNTGLIRSVNAYSPVAAGLAYSEGVTVGGGSITNSGTIEGLISAGNTNAVGRGITLTGNDITTGPLAGTREGLYGNAVVTNMAGGLIRGQNDSAIVVAGAASGYTVTIVNLAGATIQGGGTGTAAIVTNQDNSFISNSGLIDGRSSGRAIQLGDGNNTVTIQGGQAQVLGDIVGGSGTNLLVLDPGAGQSFAYGSAISNFSTVDVLSGTVTLSGASTYTGTTIIDGGVLVLDGTNRLATGSGLLLSGGTLELLHAGANGQSFASLGLDADSVIDLNGSSLSFASLGSVTGGKKLSIVDYLAGNSAYAFRLLGDHTTDTTFLSLLSSTQINGMAATYHFDGVYTDVMAVPEPSGLALMLAGLGLLGARARRQRRPARG